MAKYKLLDILEEIKEKTTKNNQYMVLTSSKEQGLISQKEYFNKKVSSDNTTGYKIIKKGEFTYDSMSPKGDFYVNLLKNYEIGIISPAYPVFKNKRSEIISNEYLELFFKSKLFMKQAQNLARGSTRYSLKFNQIKNIQINIPEIKKQKEIIKEIKICLKTIENRKNSIKDLENFIKTKFYNYKNSINGINILLKELCKKEKYSIKRGPFGSDLKKEFFVNNEDMGGGRKVSCL